MLQHLLATTSDGYLLVATHGSVVEQPTMNHCYFCTECYFYIEVNKQLEFQISQQEVYVNQIDNSSVDCVWDVHHINPEQPVSFESKLS